MKRFSKVQLDKFDECVVRTLNRIDPARFELERQRVGDYVDYQLVDKIEERLYLRYQFWRTQEGIIEHGIWMRDDQQTSRDRILQMLKQEMNREIPRFGVLIEDSVLLRSNTMVRAVYHGNLADAVNYMSFTISESTNGRVLATNKMIDEGSGFAAIGLSTPSQIKKWKSSDKNASDPEAVGTVQLRRLNHDKSRIKICAYTDFMDGLVPNILDNMEGDGVIQNVQHGTGAFTRDEDVSETSVAIESVSRTQRREAAITKPKQPSVKDLAVLGQQIADSFNMSELDDLCLCVSVNFEEIKGQTPTEKSRELVAYAHRHGKLNTLIGCCQEARPNALWRT